MLRLFWRISGCTDLPQLGCAPRISPSLVGCSAPARGTVMAMSRAEQAWPAVTGVRGVRRFGAEPGAVRRAGATWEYPAIALHGVVHLGNAPLLFPLLFDSYLARHHRLPLSVTACPWRWAVPGASGPQRRTRCLSIVIAIMPMRIRIDIGARRVVAIWIGLNIAPRDRTQYPHAQQN